MNQIIWQPGITLADIEKKIIMRALQIYGSQEKAAATLGVATKTIQNKLKKYKKEAEKSAAIDIERKKQNEIKLQQARKGISVEPDAEVSTEQTLPMQQREEVEKVPQVTNTSDSNEQGREENQTGNEFPS
jgi:DNA-binding transcriptional regulator YdaS (Cro superfamily)